MTMMLRMTGRGQRLKQPLIFYVTVTTYPECPTLNIMIYTIRIIKDKYGMTFFSSICLILMLYNTLQAGSYKSEGKLNVFLIFSLYTFF